MFDYVLNLLAAPVARLFNFEDPFNLYSITGGFLFAVSWYVMRRWRRPWKRLKLFLRLGFSPKIFGHRSSLLDYKLFIATSFIYATGYIGMLISSEYVKSGVLSGLVTVFGEPQGTAEPSVVLTGITAVAFLLMLDFAYYFAHWLMHKFPLMWEFHKIHHSAEVMTPFTEWRQHPVEVVLFPVCNAIGFGTLYAVLSYALTAEAMQFSLLQMNLTFLVFMFTILHLRHTHLWIPAKGWLGYIIQSPAHHQIHHSNDPKHWGKNLGLFLSVWDWAFGTLYIPSEKEVLEFGIGHEGHHHDGVMNAYWLPFAKAYRLIKRRIERRRKRKTAAIPAE